MPTDALDFDALRLRFNELSARDRRAVLAHLAPRDRARVEAAITAEADAERREAERVRRAGRQFAGYSAWLSPLVEAACASGTKTAEQKTATQQAIAEIHRALHNAEADAPQSWTVRLRRWSSKLFAPEEDRRQ